MELIRSGFLLLFLLLLGSSVFSAPAHLQHPRNVEARPGSAVTLWSSTSTKTNTDLCDGVVTLEVTYKGVVTAALVREGKDDVNSRDEKFKAAVLVEGLCSGNVSVKLINVTTNCSGIYTVSTIGGEPTHSPINLTVREQPDVKPANNETSDTDKQGSDHIAPIGIGIGIGITFIIVAFVIWHARKKHQTDVEKERKKTEPRGNNAAAECEERVEMIEPRGNNAAA